MAFNNSDSKHDTLLRNMESQTIKYFLANAGSPSILGLISSLWDLEMRGLKINVKCAQNYTFRQNLVVL